MTIKMTVILLSLTALGLSACTGERLKSTAAESTGMIGEGAAAIQFEFRGSGLPFTHASAGFQ